MIRGANRTSDYFPKVLQFRFIWQIIAVQLGEKLPVVVMVCRLNLVGSFNV